MGFLDPRNLLWGLSLAVLVAIYLRSRARPTIDVSSLMLFDEAAAPSASMRHVRFDLLFWLEAAALAALSLAIAGFFVRIPQRPAHGRSHALVFDLGAAMTATENGASRLDQAKHQALEIVSKAGLDDQFSVVTYALEANLVQAPTTDSKELRAAIGGLDAIAVATRPAALRAALMRARGAAQIDLFSDRPPPREALNDVASAGKFEFHRMTGSDDNLAIVSLDPGVPLVTDAHLSVRNFSLRPRTCEVVIDLGNNEIFRRALVLAPREQVAVAFGPLAAGGVLHAHILSPDALAADNSRYALATADVPVRALVISPDAAVRDDLARVLLAVNPNFRIEAVDPANYKTASDQSERFAIAIIHDAATSGVPANSTLLIFPPVGSNLVPGLAVEATADASELRDTPHASADGVPMGATRVLKIPEWMEATSNAGVAGHGLLPVSAIGQTPGGRVGVIAFDVRGRLLLDPDHLDALLGTVDLVKQLIAPSTVQIVTTGTYVSLPAPAPAKITAPDGATETVKPDKWRRVALRPLMSGRYLVESGATTIQVLANYYDANESDLAAVQSASAESSEVHGPSIAAAPREPQVQPMLLMLVMLALAALLVESVFLARRASRWGLRHV
jgi:Ca-activated chloride channel homolog